MTLVPGSGRKQEAALALFRVQPPDYGVPQSRERIIFFGFSKAALTPEAYTALTNSEAS